MEQIYIYCHFFFEKFLQISLEIFCGHCAVLELVNVTPHERVEMIWVFKKQINKQLLEMILKSKRTTERVLTKFHTSERHHGSKNRQKTLKIILNIHYDYTEDS